MACERRLSPEASAMAGAAVSPLRKLRRELSLMPGIGSLIRLSRVDLFAKNDRSEAG
jgi:hypothetical protein